MLANRPVAPKTPHTKLRNENQFATHARAFPKTPLPKELLNTAHTGKYAIELTAQPRKALVDKTPGTHLQNRGVNITLQDPNGKNFATLDQKPPSASRKSVKKPRPSAEFQTPGPETRKPYWDVSETSILEQAVQVDPVQQGDFDEPEYMPPTAQLRPIGDEYDFPSGEEVGKKILELARTPYHCYYNDVPPSFDHEVFLIPDDQLIIPLRPLSPDSDEEPTQTTSDSIQPSTTRNTRSRIRAQAPPTAPTRASSRLAKATVSSQAKTMQAISTRATNKSKDASSKSQVMKGKAKSKSKAADTGDPAIQEELLDCPPELLELFKTSQPVYEDFRFDIDDDL